GISEAGKHLYEPCRTPQFDHAYVHAALCTAYKRIQQEDREPRCGAGSLLHVLQLLPRASNFASYTRDGSGNFRPCMERRRNRGAIVQIKECKEFVVVF